MGDAAGIEKEGRGLEQGGGNKAGGAATAFSSSLPTVHTHRGEGDREVLPSVTTAEGRAKSRCPLCGSFAFPSHPLALTVHSFGTLTGLCGRWS